MKQYTLIQTAPTPPERWRRHKSRWQRFAMRARLWSFAAILLVLFIPPFFDTTKEEGKRELGKWLDMPTNLAQSDAIVIMGGDWKRLEPGVALYHQGYAPKVFYTGSPVPASALLYQITKMGVPEENTEHLLGPNTWEETRQIAVAVDEQELQSIIVVTSWYHGRRTLCTLRHHLQEQELSHPVEIYYQPVSNPTYGPDNWWLIEGGRTAVLSEVTKFGYYWFHYGLTLQDC